jgi:hypothetical protein
MEIETCRTAALGGDTAHGLVFGREALQNALQNNGTMSEIYKSFQLEAAALAESLRPHQ